MVYQEIQDTDSQIRGVIVPKDIATAQQPYLSNLLRYYRMDTYKDDIIDDLTTTAIDIVGAKFIIIKAFICNRPYAFFNRRAGDFAAAVNSQRNKRC
jgi:hypothetical protein